MSGGHFDYVQFRIHDIARQIDEDLMCDDYGFSEKTKEKMREAVKILDIAEKMATRIDWLCSGDDSEESFHERWKIELGG